LDEILLKVCQIQIKNREIEAKTAH